MMDFVVIWFDRVEHKLSLGKVQQFFPDYLDTTGLIQGIQQRIAESRGNRTKLRDAIYDAIDGDDYERVLALFDKMRNSKDRVQGEITRERIEKWALWIVTILSLAFGIWGVLK